LLALTPTEMLPVLQCVAACADTLAAAQVLN